MCALWIVTLTNGSCSTVGGVRHETFLPTTDELIFNRNHVQQSVAGRVREKVYVQIGIHKKEDDDDDDDDMRITTKLDNMEIQKDRRFYRRDQMPDSRFNMPPPRVRFSSGRARLCAAASALASPNSPAFQLPTTAPGTLFSLPPAAAPLLADEDHIRENRPTVELPDNEEIELVLRRGAAISCNDFDESCDEDNV